MNDSLRHTQSLPKEVVEALIRKSQQSQERKRLNGLKTPITIKCVVCSVEITNSWDDMPQEELAEDYANRTSFLNGAVGVLSFGYGCKYDTSVFIIGICEHCYEKKLINCEVLYTRSYMP